MKKLILFAITTTCALSVFAQGTVTFANRSAGGTSHVWIGYFPALQYQGDQVNYAALGFHLLGTGPNGLAEAQHTFAQLLGAPGSNAPESTLLPSLSPPTTFRTGAAAGNNALTTATFNNIAPDALVATFEMVAWDNSSGLYPTWAQASFAYAAGLIVAGRSAPFVLQNIGGTVFTPPNLEPGLQSFSVAFIIPEPTTIALAGLGAGAFLVFRRRS